MEELVRSKLLSSCVKLNGGIYSIQLQLQSTQSHKVEQSFTSIWRNGLGIQDRSFGLIRSRKYEYIFIYIDVYLYMYIFTFI